MYGLEIKPSCRNEIVKACKKNPVLKKAIENKINEILLNPAHYKPLRYDLAGERRVHILKSFVLVFEIDDNERNVTFLRFRHHDDAYRT
ncbi:MAG: type II toxin-antitoxin system RelE/ParE family toxin [Candidatus Methanoperedens sp.]